MVSNSLLARMTLIHDTTIGFDLDFPNWNTWPRARHGERGSVAWRAVQPFADGVSKLLPMATAWPSAAA